MDQGPDHINKTEARQATTPHMTRYILMFSVGLIVLVFAILLLVYR